MKKKATDANAAASGEGAQQEQQAEGRVGMVSWHCLVEMR